MLQLKPMLQLMLVQLMTIKLVLQEQLRRQVLHWPQPQPELKLRPSLQVIVEPRLMLVALV